MNMIREEFQTEEILSSYKTTFDTRFILAFLFKRKYLLHLVSTSSNQLFKKKKTQPICWGFDFCSTWVDWKTVQNAEVYSKYREKYWISETFYKKFKNFREKYINVALQVFHLTLTLNIYGGEKRS